VANIGTGPRVNLIERVAGLIAEALLREFPTHEVCVRVRKITAPLAGLTGTPGVELRRKR
jgi:dihydroneopterin aldolase